MAKSFMPPPAGIAEVMGLIRFLADPVAVEAKLRELNGLRDEINDRLETEETLERTQALESDARQKLAEATRLLDEANATSTRIRAEAEADVTAQRANLSASRAEWSSERASQQDSLKAAVSSVEERERLARAESEKARTTLARAEYLMSEAMKLKDEYNDKTNALKGIVGG